MFAKPVSTFAEYALRSRSFLANLTPRKFRRILSDGAVEHDRFCPKPRRQRTLRVRMGIEVGQRQGFRLAYAAAARMGGSRCASQEARRRSAVAGYAVPQFERQARQPGLYCPYQ